MLKKILIIINIAVLVMALVTGCSSNAVTKDITEVNEITICESWDFENGFSSVITPSNNSNYGINYYLCNFYETLVNYENGKIVPGLAESWLVSDDGLVYTFNLKQGIKFSDGADFNAEVVKKNLEMIPKLSGIYVTSFASVPTLIKDIKVANNYKIEVHLTTPYYGTLQDFTKLNPFGIMSPNAFTEDDELSDKIIATTLGTGPYMFDSKLDTGNYVFVYNPNYHGQKPDIEKFYVKVIPDNEAKALALRNGEIDLIFGSSKISYDGFKEFTDNKDFNTKVSDTSIKSRFLCFNLNQDPFNDKNIRLAVNHAINKQSIIDNLLYGLEKKSDSFFNKKLPYCNVNITPYEHDFDKANQLLTEAGWIDQNGDGIREKNGKKLIAEFLYPSGKGNVEQLVLTFASVFKKIGIDIKLTGLDFMAWYAKLQEGAYSIAYKETYDIPFDPYTTITNMNSSIMVDNAIIQALSHLPNGNDRIIELNSLTDEDVIQEKYNYLLNEIHKNVTFVPISHMNELVVFNSNKILDYEFFGQPSIVNLAGVKTK
ncbi:ABC transporter substrate-binding protein [Clostridium sp. 'deep sea']|uniref:ABC transporter substrate-binding protein n=1 Tax=Clostridium sp. 'deep sea' TaxID=2779445 RepID=UPI001896906A|nr:ABC transporter substrate-binding protein [Clostridium sp. 'deep sea']QOR36164.1 ABC transporter substrate-binding protein [Clostridium sp. 'deep sea']